MPIAREKFFEALDKNIGMLCLTEKRDNRLMWSHYSQNHQGLVIEFEAEHSYFHQQKTDVDEFGYLRKVEYRAQRPDYAELIEMSAADVFLVKGEEWAYEEEWRMLRPLKEADRIIESKEGNIHLFTIDPMCITGVIFGCQMSRSKKQEIIKILNDDKVYSQVKKYQALRKERGYGLDIVPSEI